MNQSKKDSLTINESDKTLDKLRSFIFKMNAKPDSITRAFSKQIKIDLDAIYNLNTIIIEKLRMHCQGDNLITRITINYCNHRTYEYDVWEKFENESQKNSGCIENITIKWSFMVNMPQYEMPQPHNLVVKISSGLSFAEYMNLMVSGNFENVNEVTIMDSTVLARVEFINTLLGEELLNIVSKWVDSCVRNNYTCSKPLLFLKKYRSIVATCVHYITHIVFSCLIFILISFYVNNLISSLTDITNSFIRKIIMTIGITYSSIFLLQKITHKVAQMIYQNLTNYGEGCVFEITTGDINKISNLKNLNKRLGFKLVFNLVLTFLCDLVISIIISHIV